MRMSRSDWLSRFFRPLFGPRRSKAPARPPGRPVLPWSVRTPGDGAVVVEARTKSEARALAKGKLGFARRQRLPVGTVVAKKGE